MKNLLNLVLLGISYITMSKGIKRALNTKITPKFSCSVRVKAWTAESETLLEYLIDSKTITKQYFLCIPVKSKDWVILYSSDEDRTILAKLKRPSIGERFSELVVEDFTGISPLKVEGFTESTQ